MVTRGPDPDVGRTHHGPRAPDGVTGRAAGLTPRERQVLEFVSDGQRNSGELAKLMGISQQAVLRWLNRLADQGLVRATEPVRRNRRNRWELNPGY